MDSKTLSKGEQTRNQIVEAAHRLFLQQGYHGTSMREISREAKIALGGIYNHFPTKEAIFEAVFFTYHPYNQIYPAVKQARQDSIEIMLKDIAHFLIEGLNQHPDFLNLFFIDFVEFQAANTSKLLQKQLPFLTEVSTRAVQVAGSRLRPLPPLILTRSFFGLFFSYFITGLILRATPGLPLEVNENAFDHFMDIYLHGILVEEKEA